MQPIPVRTKRSIPIPLTELLCNKASSLILVVGISVTLDVDGCLGQVVVDELAEHDEQGVVDLGGNVTLRHRHHGRASR